MPGTWRRLFAHAVWSTWDRAPIVTAEIEAHVAHVIAEQCTRLRCEAMAIGAADDHVHVLLALHPAVAPAVVVRAMKSASSHAVRSRYDLSSPFRWQGGYAILSVSPEQVPRVAAYVRDQRAHHAHGESREAWEPRAPDEPDAP